MDTLYDLANEYTDIVYALEQDSPDEDIINKLENINEQFEHKAVNIAVIINKLEEDNNIIQKEIDRLQKRSLSKLNCIERLKKYLKDNMVLCRKSRIESPTHTLSLRTYYKTNVSEEFIKWAISNNKEYLITTKTTYTPNKKIIKDELESGELNCPFTQIEETQNILIK